MKIFNKQNELHTYNHLAAEMGVFITDIISFLIRSPKKTLLTQLSLYVFHVHAKIATYPKIDRFIYVCAAILFAGKITEQIEYPLDIVKISRQILRRKRNKQGEDSEEKNKFLLKKVFEAEVNIMVSLGFDFQIVTGLSFLQQWEKEIKDSHFAKVAEQALTKLYHSNVVLYFQPFILALTALDIAAKSQGVTPQICGWSPWLLELFQRQQKRINSCSEHYYDKLNKIYYYKDED